MIEFSEKDGILSYGIFSGKSLDKLSKSINLKAFYNELHDLLVDEGYKDILGTQNEIKKGEFFGNWAKAGEQVDSDNANRHADMFEKHFSLIETESASDIEIVWLAFKKTPYSKYGWFEFKLDVVNRFLQDKEILDGNNKKVLQSGTWEFRNKFTYKNNVINKYLKKIPYVKNSKLIQDLYLKHIYRNVLENDVQICEDKLHPKINKLILKYFN